MKFTSIALLGSFLMNNNVAAFTPASFARSAPKSNARFMAMEEAAAPVAPADNLPIIQSRGGAPVDVRYSDFLRLVDANKIEKVTFSADGTQLLGVDTEGVRIKIEALPNDPELLTQLTGHKVRSFFVEISFHIAQVQKRTPPSARDIRHHRTVRRQRLVLCVSYVFCHHICLHVLSSHLNILGGCHRPSC